MKTRSWLWRVGLTVISLIVLAACGPALAGESTATPSNPAVTAAIEFLAAEHGLSVEAIAVVNVAAVDWTDSCLGLGGPAESCLAAITPGYQVQLEADGVEYEVRTDADGSAVRIK